MATCVHRLASRSIAWDAAETRQIYDHRLRCTFACLWSKSYDRACRRRAGYSRMRPHMDYPNTQQVGARVWDCRRTARRMPSTRPNRACDVSKSPPSRMGGLLGVWFHRRRAVSGTCRLNAKRRDGPYAIPAHMPLRMPYSAEAERPHNCICIPCDASLGVQAVTGHANRRQPPTIHGLPAHGGRRFMDSDGRFHPRRSVDAAHS